MILLNIAFTNWKDKHDTQVSFWSWVLSLISAQLSTISYLTFLYHRSKKVGRKWCVIMCPWQRNIDLKMILEALSVQRPWSLLSSSTGINIKTSASSRHLFLPAGHKFTKRSHSGDLVDWTKYVAFWIFNPVDVSLSVDRKLLLLNCFQVTMLEFVIVPLTTFVV